MSKPQAVRYPSDDCAVEIGGATYHPHEGEYVDVLPGLTIGELRQLESFKQLGVKLAAAQGEPDEAEQALGAVTTAVNGIAALLARRVTAWDWTDNAGRPMPALDGTATPFDDVSEDELLYLLLLVKGQPPVVEKNASEPSPTITSATEQTPSQE